MAPQPTPPKPAGPLPANQVYVLRNRKWVVEERAVKPSGPLPKNKTYVYDEAGNRWRLVDSSVGPQPGEAPRPRPATTPTPEKKKAPAEPAQEAPAEQPVPTDWEAAAAEIYGGYYAIVKNIPEIKNLLLSAVQNGWSDNKFDYELKQTNWWKTTTSSAREWEVSRQLDPASAQTQIDNRVANIRQKALTKNLRLDDTTLAKLAEDSIKFGWTEQVLDTAISSEALKTTTGVSELRQGFIGQNIRTTANAYGLPLSGTSFNEWVGKIATGQENEASFQAWALETSKNLYPSLAASFDRGLTFKQVTDPYAQAASRILEIPTSQIDFTDPKWAQAFTARDDKGQQMQMSFGEWNDYLRTNPAFGYEYTDGAKERAFTVVNRLAELFGAA